LHTKYGGGLNRILEPYTDNNSVNKDQKNPHQNSKSEASVGTQDANAMHRLDEFGIRDPIESLCGLSSDNPRTDNEVNNSDDSEQGGTKISLELDPKGSTDHLPSAEKSIYDMESLGSELDSKIPDRDYAESVIRTIKQTVKQEDTLVRQIVYTAISKDSTNPINLAVLAPTSEGKTYPVLESLQYFPYLEDRLYDAKSNNSPKWNTG